MPAALRPGVNCIRPDWPAPDNICAFTTTRQSEGLPEEVAGMAVPKIRQVHGNQVVNAVNVVDGIEADAIHTTERGVGCAVLTADCLPVLFCNREGSHIAAAHAGWRGLAAGVLENTLAALDCDPAELLAWIGPAISQDCYEVGGDVLEACLRDIPAELAAPTQACFAPRGDKFHADLPGLARLRLQHRGVGQVYGGELCTFSDSTRFHSWRRDGEAAGRLTSLICMLP